VLQGAKTEPDAVERHRRNLQRSLGLIAKAGSWYPSKTARGGEEWVMRTSPDNIELRTVHGSVLFLTAAQNFVVRFHHRLVLDAGLITGYKAHTTGYAYSVGIVPDPDQALLEWHWHPPDPGYTHAHVHVRDETLGNVGKLHLPTARVFFEQVVGFLIVGLEVEATVEDWRSPLADVIGSVKRAATWRGERP
jgi:hypothetical protein